MVEDTRLVEVGVGRRWRRVERREWRRARGSERVVGFREAEEKSE